ncbi:hypothetical protein [Robertkochia sediminum]|uniref:hypothetical protein n=1 Tax=Robertkochia sediminum TaxID=2785326 RepID=UPI00193182AB|nr:hypothetical protein [Robertkochia sediminum]MBL7473119.1 hypothetical protein [Robertkochia sediminum]
MKKDPSHKDSGFRLPDDYFNDLEDRIRERRELADAEDHLPDREGFVLPEGYFEDLGARISDRINKEEKEEKEDSPKIIPFHQKLWRYAGIAAAVTLLIAGTWVLSTENNTITFDDLQMADVEWLLDQGALDIPQQFLIEEANDTLLMELTMAENMLDEQLLENYLSEEADLYELMD